MTGSDWMTLFQANGINLGTQVYVVLDAGGGSDGGTLQGTVVVIAPIGSTAYLRLALTGKYGGMPVGALLTIVADHVAAVAPAVTAGGD